VSSVVPLLGRIAHTLLDGREDTRKFSRCFHPAGSPT
jgi:hypothetical protein